MPHCRALGRNPGVKVDGFDKDLEAHEGKASSDRLMERAPFENRERCGSLAKDPVTLTSERSAIVSDMENNCQ